jgi:hypothetical protein
MGVLYGLSQTNDRKEGMTSNTEVARQVHEAMQAEKQREREERQNAKVNERYKTILATLADLGGKVFHDEDILFQGDKLTIPKNMTLAQAKKFIEMKEAELEKPTDFTHVFNYRPYDGAWCAWNFMKRTFGVVGHKDRLIKTMFGTEKAPPMMVDIPIDVDKTEQIPWGRVELPFMPGAVFEFETFYHEDKGPLFWIQCTSPKKFKFEIEGIFRGIEEELRERSLYRGKAFDGQENPEFIDLSSVDPKRVVYSKEVMAQLEANIWAQLRHTDEFVKQGIPLKRAVLIHGPFGTGKTLAALLTGQEAAKAGWTFIKARPGRDNIFVVMQTARLYEPCVVFYEDVDQIVDAEAQDRAGVAQLLDVFDGIEAKGTKILCVLTTNYPDKIHKGMARPGRLDAMIEISELDQDGVEALVRTRLSPDMLEDEIDWAAVFAAAIEYKPAFVTEFADRTMRYVIAEHGTMDDHRVGTRALVNAAHGLRPQYEKMVGAKEIEDRYPIENRIGQVVEKQIRDSVQVKLLNKPKDNAYVG